jgi:prepilin-type processing-associated H-X9-DG protein
MADILPMLMMRRAEEIVQTPHEACSANLKQLSLGFMMYIQDFDQMLPGTDWAQTTQPYLKNVQILTCPSRPDLEVGYAMNEKLLEAEVGRIRNVSRTIMLFESNIGGESPVGGPEALPDEPIHGDQIVVAFVDGHVENVSLDEARELLERDPFE